LLAAINLCIALSKPETQPTLNTNVSILTATDQRKVELGFLFISDRKVAAVGTSNPIEKLFPMNETLLLSGEWTTVWIN
jgi:hypothetical protein